MGLMLRHDKQDALSASLVAHRPDSRSLAIAAAFSQGDAPTYGL